MYGLVPANIRLEKKILPTHIITLKRMSLWCLIDKVRCVSNRTVELESILHLQKCLIGLLKNTRLKKKNKIHLLWDQRVSQYNNRGISCWHTLQPRFQQSVLFTLSSCNLKELTASHSFHTQHTVFVGHQ